MGLESLHLIVPHVPSSVGRMPVNGRSYFAKINQASTFRIAHRSTLFRSCRNLRDIGLKSNRSADSDELLGEDMAKVIRFLAVNFDKDDDQIDDSEISPFSAFDDKKQGIRFSGSFFPSKQDILVPEALGIRPEWRNEIPMTFHECQTNSRLAIGIMKKKRRWQESLIVDAGDFVFCSVKKAFSCMVFMIRELQVYALSIRDSICSEEIQMILKDFNRTFVWLFQQVFAPTPNLMLYVMLLLANFTALSMAGNTAIAATMPAPTFSCETITESIEEMTGEEAEVGYGGKWDSRSISPWVRNVFNESVQVEEEEEGLWNLTMKIEPDKYVEYFRTDLYYQMKLAGDPNNPLLLSNYAQFLSLVLHDHERAEKCFKQALLSEPQDAMILSHYADFLWKTKNDLWSAEERFQQATEAEPSSHFHTAKYALFLWNTGAVETCYLLADDMY